MDYGYGSFGDDSVALHPINGAVIPGTTRMNSTVGSIGAIGQKTASGRSLSGECHVIEKYQGGN
jgi:hypothetical protein